MTMKKPAIYSIIIFLSFPGSGITAAIPWEGSIQTKNLECGFDNRPVAATIDNGEIVISLDDFGNNRRQITGDVSGDRFRAYSRDHFSFKGDGGGARGIASIEGKITLENIQGTFAVSQSSGGFRGDTIWCFGKIDLVPVRQQPIVQVPTARQPIPADTFFGWKDGATTISPKDRGTRNFYRSGK